MEMRFKPSENNVRVLGRTKIVDSVRYIDYSCSGIEFEFVGTSVKVVLCTNKSEWDENFRAWAAVFVDDEAEPSKRFSLDDEEGIYNLYENSVSRKVKIRLMKMSESAFAKLGIKEIIIEGDGKILPTNSKEHRIEFIGDSITCGYGIEGVLNVDIFRTSQENPWEAYAAKSARHFDADFNCVSWSGMGIISSYTEEEVPNTKEGLMPELYKYTDESLDKILSKDELEIWDHHRFEPHLIVINLGTNDSSYTKGIEERQKAFEDGYYDFLKQVRSCNPNSQIICALGVMGQELCPVVEAAVQRFKASTGDEKIYTLVFEEQKESDGIGTDFHPSLKTQDKMSKKLIGKIEEVMGW